MMKYNEDYEGKHCCELMKRMLEDYRTHLDYNPEENKYFIPFNYPFNISQTLFYCPWCGRDIRPKEDK